MLTIHLAHSNGSTPEARIQSPRVIETTADEKGVFAELPKGDDSEESLADARKRIFLRYNAMGRLARKLIERKLPSLIVSGPPGLGKSYTLDTELSASGRYRHDGLEPLEDGGNWYDHISGGCTAPGLYHALWNMRQGGVLLIDDCDAVFHDEESINLLKIATDSSKKRLLSWRKRAHWLDLYKIDRTFDFNGHVAFLTNIDFEQEIQKNNRHTEHFKALIDRAHYLCLTLRTQRDFMIRIRQVAIEEGMLERDHRLNALQAETVLQYIEENKYRFYNLSLRLVGQIAIAMQADPDHWQADVEATKMKTQI